MDGYTEDTRSEDLRGKHTTRIANESKVKWSEVHPKSMPNLRSSASKKYVGLLVVESFWLEINSDLSMLAEKGIGYQINNA